jgi:hypothetical protein
VIVVLPFHIQDGLHEVQRTATPDPELASQDVVLVPTQRLLVDRIRDNVYSPALAFVIPDTALVLAIRTTLMPCVNMLVKLRDWLLFHF